MAEIAVVRDSDSRGDSADERIPISLSSETPVERWFGQEILDHAAGAVELARAADGLPLLHNHNTDDQIGVIENVELADRKIRGMMRFSQSPRGQEMRQDVLDGIRRNASIGYRIHELVLEKSDETGEIYRATRWELLEGSLVPVPADQTVGVGRGAEESALPVIVRSTPTAPEAKERTVAENTAAQNGAAIIVGPENEAERTRKLSQLARVHGMQEQLPEWIEQGRSVDQVKDMILDTRKPQPIALPKPVEEEVSKKERRPYSLGRAVLASIDGDWSQAAYEREISQMLARRLGGSPNGFYVPLGELSARTIHTTGGSTTGQDLVATEMGTFIELLRNTSVVMGLNPIYLPGLVGNLALGRQTAAGTAYWSEESPASDVTESNMTFDQVELSPKDILATQAYSKRLAAQSVPTIDTLVRSDLTTILGLKFDRDVFHGSGAANDITGLYTLGSVNSVAMGGAITFGKVVDMESAIEADNAALAGLAYVTTPEVKGKAKQTAIISNTAGIAIWTGGVDGEMNGYRAVASNQISKLLGSASPPVEHGILFGAWSQAIMADWGAIDITVNPYTKARRAVIEVTAHWMVDFAVRHPESFCKGTGLTVS